MRRSGRRRTPCRRGSSPRRHALRQGAHRSSGERHAPERVPPEAPLEERPLAAGHALDQRARETDGPCVGAVEPSLEDVGAAAVPGRAVDERPAVGSEPGGGQLGFITGERLTDALARAKGVPAADLRALQPEAVDLVPKRLAQRFKVFPCRVRGKTLFLGMVDPGDHAAVAHVGYSLGYIVRPLVVPEFRMVQLLRDHYGIDERWRYADTRAAAPAVPEVREPAAAALRIDAATTRDEVVTAVLALGRCYFRRVVFFIVREPWVLGWDGAGEGLEHRNTKNDALFLTSKDLDIRISNFEKTWNILILSISTFIVSIVY